MLNNSVVITVNIFQVLLNPMFLLSIEKMDIWKYLNKYKILPKLFILLQLKVSTIGINTTFADVSTSQIKRWARIVPKYQQIGA